MKNIPKIVWIYVVAAICLMVADKYTAAFVVAVLIRLEFIEQTIREPQQ